MKRVVVTGIGMVSPLGLDLETSWQRVLAGETGIAPISRFDPCNLNARVAAEVKNFEPTTWLDPKDGKRLTRFISLSLASAAQGFAHAGLDRTRVDPERAGVSFGVGIGGIDFIRESSVLMAEKGPKRVSPFLIPYSIANMPAGLIACRFGFKGPNICTTTACTSSTHAIGEAWLYIRTGMADVMLAGGGEAAIEPLAMAGFDNMRALSRNPDPATASRPFDTDRDGFVMGEAGVSLVLEEFEHARSRGATILAELAGYGLSGDAHHITAPPPGGEGAQRCMEAALRSAKLKPCDIDYINAHGTSTPLNDRVEGMAIASVFAGHLGQLRVSSTKGATGHCLGAAGAVEAAFCVLALRDQILPPTAGTQHVDPEIEMPILCQATPSRVDAVLTNSFGFGGTNGSLVFTR